MIFFLALALLLPTHLLSMAGANVLNKQEAQWFLNYYCQPIQYQATHSPCNLPISDTQMHYLGSRYNECQSAITNGQQGSLEVVEAFCFSTEPKTVYVDKCTGTDCRGYNLLGVDRCLMYPCGRLCMVPYSQKIYRKAIRYFSSPTFRKSIVEFGEGALIGLLFAAVVIPVSIGVGIFSGAIEIKAPAQC